MEKTVLDTPTCPLRENIYYYPPPMEGSVLKVICVPCDESGEPVLITYLEAA